MKRDGRHRAWCPEAQRNVAKGAKLQELGWLARTGFASWVRWKGADHGLHFCWCICGGGCAAGVGAGRGADASGADVLEVSREENCVVSRDAPRRGGTSCGGGCGAARDNRRGRTAAEGVLEMAGARSLRTALYAGD